MEEEWGGYHYGSYAEKEELTYTSDTLYPNISFLGFELTYAQILVIRKYCVNPVANTAIFSYMDEYNIKGSFAPSQYFQEAAIVIANSYHSDYHLQLALNLIFNQHSFFSNNNYTKSNSLKLEKFIEYFSSIKTLIPIFFRNTICLDENLIQNLLNTDNESLSSELLYEIITSLDLDGSEISHYFFKNPSSPSKIYDLIRFANTKKTSISFQKNIQSFFLSHAIEMFNMDIIDEQLYDHLTTLELERIATSLNIQYQDSFETINLGISTKNCIFSRDLNAINDVFLLNLIRFKDKYYLNYIKNYEGNHSILFSFIVIFKHIELYLLLKNKFIGDKSFKDETLDLSNVLIIQKLSKISQQELLKVKIETSLQIEGALINSLLKTEKFSFVGIENPSTFVEIIHKRRDSVFLFTWFMKDFTNKFSFNHILYHPDNLFFLYSCILTHSTTKLFSFQSLIEKFNINEIQVVDETLTPHFDMLLTKKQLQYENITFTKLNIFNLYFQNILECFNNFNYEGKLSNFVFYKKEKLVKDFIESNYTSSFSEKFYKLLNYISVFQKQRDLKEVFAIINNNKKLPKKLFFFSKQQTQYLNYYNTFDEMEDSILMTKTGYKYAFQLYPSKDFYSEILVHKFLPFNNTYVKISIDDFIQQSRADILENEYLPEKLHSYALSFVSMYENSKEGLLQVTEYEYDFNSYFLKRAPELFATILYDYQRNIKEHLALKSLSNKFASNNLNLEEQIIMIENSYIEQFQALNENFTKTILSYIDMKAKMLKYETEIQKNVTIELSKKPV